MSKLVIVESPTKIKKLKQYLPAGFEVDSCVGHIRDLPSSKSEVPAAIKDKPWADFAVDVEHDFQPHYITIRGKGKVITELKRKLKDATELLLATDEDREGESISWHLIEALKPKVPVKRMVFNEITKKAVLEALENTREMDMDLVQAQETRRILDRLYGYALSPLLWKKVGGNLSAGRVQSVAVRLVVQRERERRAFVAGSYWDLTATLHKDRDFEARLHSVEGKRIASGKDFDKDTGAIIEGRDVLLLEEDAARALQARLKDATWTVSDVKQRQGKTSPNAPFITSTLQQEASNRLNLGAKQSMQIAQRLYQEGFITYMRTDSTHLSEEAVKGARAAASTEFGAQHVADTARDYANKSKNAQEAHEAIRPAGEEFQHPDRSGLEGKDRELYRLIWQRTLASQMRDEEFTSTTAQITAENAQFVATGKRVDSPGWRLAYPASGDRDTELPQLREGDLPDLKELGADGHETKPPARFTEASLVKALEEEGIGRPSTYASIMDTIQNRGYVVFKGKALVPTFTAFAVTGLLEKNFPRLVDPKFTSEMEDTLDAISRGESDWIPFLRTFFSGENGLEAQIAERMASMDPEQARIIDLGDMPFIVRIGRFGPYVDVERDGERITASIPEAVTPDELDEALLERLILQKQEGPKSLGEDPETKKPVFILDGRFGPYYQLGEPEGKAKPPRASLPKGKKIDDASLEEGLWLLSLPKELGPHPDGGTVLAGLGRYGPYIMLQPPGEGKATYANVPSVDTLKTISLPEAVQVLAEKAAGGGGRGGRGAGPTVIKEMGNHPDGKPIQLLAGRYGPYLKHEKTNASLPKDMDPDSVTLEAAIEMIADKKAKGGKKPATRRKRS